MLHKKLYYIEWFDAITMNNGWYNIKTVQTWGSTQDWLIRQAGFILAETKDYILLASKYNPQETEESKYSEITKIPKGWIKKKSIFSF